MWRNSLSLTSNFAASSNLTGNPVRKSLILLRSSQTELLSTYYGFFGRSSSTTAGPTTSSSSVVESENLGFRTLDRARSFVPVDTSPFAAADLARHYGQCYWELSKAKLSMLVVATSGAGYVLGSAGAVDFGGLCYTCAGTMMVAASASTLNQVFEIKNDALMKRTNRRPLPSGRISVPHAVTWASSVGIAGTALLASKANILAAGLGASNLILYAFVYTPLKQIHPVNTWVGAVVGAIPPLLGWVAACGQVSLNGLLLPAALYFWQLPHFMALAYMCRDDYAAGGFRMLSLGDASGKRTAAVALRNCIYLLPLGYLAYDWGISSAWFCLESTLLALAITGTALSFYVNRTTKDARRMFHASLLYLPVFMTGLMFHRVSDNNASLSAENSPRMELSSASNNFLQETEKVNMQNKVKRSSPSNRGRPPVAYASVAPFPFLPAPVYAPS